LALKLAEALWPAESFTSAVNKNVPACVGVPVIEPVDALSVSPGGKAPPITLQL